MLEAIYERTRVKVKVEQGYAIKQNAGLSKNGILIVKNSARACSDPVWLGEPKCLYGEKWLS